MTSVQVIDQNEHGHWIIQFYNISRKLIFSNNLEEFHWDDRDEMVPSFLVTNEGVMRDINEAITRFISAKVLEK